MTLFRFISMNLSYSFVVANFFIFNNNRNHNSLTQFITRYISILLVLYYDFQNNIWFLISKKKIENFNDQLTAYSHIAGLKFVWHCISQVLNYHLGQESWLRILNFPDTFLTIPLWAIPIQVSLTECKNPKIPGIQPKIL